MGKYFYRSMKKPGLVLRLVFFTSFEIVGYLLQSVCIFLFENEFIKITVDTPMTKYVFYGFPYPFKYVSFRF